MKTLNRSVWLALAAGFCSSANALTVLTEGHADIGFGYESPKMFEPHVHSEANDEEYEPYDALFYLGENTRDTRPVGAGYDFLGLPAGATYWRLPDSDEVGKLYLGLGLEEIAQDEPDFAPYIETDARISPGPAQRWVTISVLGKRGPGEVSGFLFGDDSPTVWYASSDGFDASDKIIAPAGSHTHLNWAFSAAGLYELDLQASAYFDTNGSGDLDAGDELFRSDVATYRFGVEAVPEPATLLALGAGLAAMARKRRIS